MEFRAQQRQCAVYAVVMESACVPAEDDEAVVRLGGDRGWVRLWNRTDPFKDDPYGKETVSFCIAIGAPDMGASLHGDAQVGAGHARNAGVSAGKWACGGNLGWWA